MNYNKGAGKNKLCAFILFNNRKQNKFLSRRKIRMNKKITVIGSLNYDVILKIPRLPFKGETLTANGADI